MKLNESKHLILVSITIIVLTLFIINEVRLISNKQKDLLIDSIIKKDQQELADTMTKIKDSAYVFFDSIDLEDIIFDSIDLEDIINWNVTNPATLKFVDIKTANNQIKDTLTEFLNENITEKNTFDYNKYYNGNIKFLLDDTMRVQELADAFLIITQNKINPKKVDIFGSYYNTLSSQTKDKLYKNRIDTTIDICHFVKPKLLSSNNKDFNITMTKTADSIQTVVFLDSIAFKPLIWHWDIIPINAGNKRLRIELSIYNNKAKQETIELPVKNIYVKDQNLYRKILSILGISPELLWKIFTGIFAASFTVYVYFKDRANKKLSTELEQAKNTIKEQTEKIDTLYKEKNNALNKINENIEKSVVETIALKEKIQQLENDKKLAYKFFDYINSYGNYNQLNAFLDCPIQPD